MQQGKLSKKGEITARAAGGKPGRQNEEMGFVFLLQIRMSHQTERGKSHKQHTIHTTFSFIDA